MTTKDLGFIAGGTFKEAVITAIHLYPGYKKRELLNEIFDIHNQYIIHQIKTQKDLETEANVECCPKCKSEIKTIKAGISKKTGQPYEEFKACSNRNCDYKPVTERDLLAQNLQDKADGIPIVESVNLDEVDISKI